MYREDDLWSGSVNVDVATLQKYTRMPAGDLNASRIDAADKCRGFVMILRVVLSNAPVDRRHFAGLSVCLPDACAQITTLILYA